MQDFYEIMDAMQVMDYLMFGFLGIISYFLRDVHAGMKEHKRQSELQHLHFSDRLS